MAQGCGGGGGAAAMGVAERQKFVKGWPNIPPWSGVVQSVSMLYTFDAERGRATGFKRPSAVLRNLDDKLVHVKSNESVETVSMTISFWELIRVFGFEVPKTSKAVWVQHDMSLWLKVIQHDKTKQTTFMQQRWARSEGKVVLVLESEYLESKMMQEMTEEEYRHSMPNVSSLVALMVVNKWMGLGDLNQRNIMVTGDINEKNFMVNARSFVRCDCAFIEASEIRTKFNARGLQTSMYMKFQPTLSDAIRTFIAQEHAKIASWCLELISKHQTSRHPEVRYRLFDDLAALQNLRGGAPGAIEAFRDDVFRSPLSDKRQPASALGV